MGPGKKYEDSGEVFEQQVKELYDAPDSEPPDESEEKEEEE